jgi:hypothetical protein
MAARETASAHALAAAKLAPEESFPFAKWQRAQRQQ